MNTPNIKGVKVGNLKRGLLHRGAQPCGPRAQSVPPTIPHAHRRRGLARVRHRRGARSTRRCEMDRLHHRPGPGELGEVRREDHPVRRHGKGCGHERRLHRASDLRRWRRHPRCRRAARVRPWLHGKPGPHASQSNGHGAAPSRRGLRKNGPWPAHFLRRWDGHHRRADLPPRPHAHRSGGILAGAHCKPRSACARPVGADGG